MATLHIPNRHVKRAKKIKNLQRTLGVEQRRAVKKGVSLPMINSEVARKGEELVFKLKKGTHPKVGKCVKKKVGAKTTAKNKTIITEGTAKDTVLPFDEARYDTLWSQFKQYDEGTECLTWNQLQQLASTTHHTVDYTVFKRIDKDRSGTVDFNEMLRLFYPQVRSAELKWAEKHWGHPASQAIQENTASEGPQPLSPRSAEELLAIFEVLRGAGVPTNTRAAEYTTPTDGPRLARDQLRVTLSHNPHITLGDIDLLFGLHGTTVPGTLSFAEFTDLMRDVVVGTGKDYQSHIKYSFVPKPLPAPEL